jgi:uncharacterized protein (TIGR03032 family)
LPAGPAAAAPIECEYTPNLVAILEELKASLWVSTYQAGKVVVARVRNGELEFGHHSFERPMGMTIARERIAVGTHSQIWFLASSPDIAPRISPPGSHDGCYLARACHVTGEIRCHELEWGGNDLWIVNTLFSCLCTLAPHHNFVPRWKPPFISTLAAEDRCHLNGMAMENGRPRFVTCLGASDEQEGWRPAKAEGGCVIDVPSGQVVVRGLSMPHSPRLHQGRLWLLESGRGRLVALDPGAERARTVAVLPGYARGLAFLGRYAVVGMSKIRQTATSAGLPVAEDLDSLKCGIAVVDVTSGKLEALLEWHSGIEEIFDVRLNTHSRWPFVSGPYSRQDATHPVWVVPTPRYDLGARQNPAPA